MTTLGIDPGKDGGVVLLGDRPISATPTGNIIGKAKWHGGGAAAMRDHIASLHAEHHIDLAVLELFAGRSMEGRGSTMTIGVGWGACLGILLGLGIPVLTPASNSWTKDMFNGIQGEGKERSIAYCRMFLPGIDLTPGAKRVPHDGIADAACLAAWGQRQNHSRS